MCHQNVRIDLSGLKHVESMNPVLWDGTTTWKISVELITRMQLTRTSSVTSSAKERERNNAMTRAWSFHAHARIHPVTNVEHNHGPRQVYFLCNKLKKALVWHTKKQFQENYKQILYHILWCMVVCSRNLWGHYLIIIYCINKGQFLLNSNNLFFQGYYYN